MEYLHLNGLVVRLVIYSKLRVPILNFLNGFIQTLLFLQQHFLLNTKFIHVIVEAFSQVDLVVALRKLYFLVRIAFNLLDRQLDLILVYFTAISHVLQIGLVRITSLLFAIVNPVLYECFDTLSL